MDEALRYLRSPAESTVFCYATGGSMVECRSFVLRLPAALPRVPSRRFDTRLDCRARRERSRLPGLHWTVGIALRVYLDALFRRARVAHDPKVFRERFGVRRRPEFVQKAGRAFHVGEEEGDGAGRRSYRTKRSSAGQKLVSIRAWLWRQDRS